MIDVNNLRPGNTFLLDKNIFVVITVNHSHQGRGQATVKAKIKNLKTGAIINKSWSGGGRLEKAHIDKQDMLFLYKEADNFVFMNNQNYEQISINKDKLTWESNFLTENSNILVRMFDGKILDVELPANVKLTITDTEAGIKGDTKTNATKAATLETGFVTQVPLFVTVNTKILVSTKDGKYVSRAE